MKRELKITGTTLRINDIAVRARHGVLDHEKTIDNDFAVSVELRFDATCAMEHDDLNNTVNYAEVVQIVKDVMSISSGLIEHVAWRIVKALCEAFPTVEGGSVEVTKLHPPVGAKTDGATFKADFAI